ncbi:hypothetical protein ONZ51_g2174 [Trametes cubensis]|uniref:Uncharacterized protein n=1 Tax=Trametes cubensis TaxID=1111947 RepID=A0AAD7XES2_9APHY|nr:hypothetical protein ONZ51_g2174 [Trametes cubensis]
MVFVGDKKYACANIAESCEKPVKFTLNAYAKARRVVKRPPFQGRQGKARLFACHSGSFKVSARAAFPGGLPPELLEASAATRPLSEGSDSDHAVPTAATTAPFYRSRLSNVQPPPLGIHVPPIRAATHGQPLYSPYGRAYEMSHIAEPVLPQTAQPPSSSNTGAYGNWPLPNSAPLCNCGSTCACAGCLEHNGPNVDLSASCANPSTCAACLECNLNALTSLASDIIQPVYDNSSMQNVDEWLRHMSTMPDYVAPSMGPPQPLAEPEPRFGSSNSQPYGAWSDFRQAPSSYSTTYPMESECCGGRCKCPTGMCGCPPDCCGCCQGCNCVGCNHDTASERTLTFATSGERAPCCGGRDHPADRSSQLLMVPRETPSRGTSLSSNSSPIPSPSSSSPMPYSNVTDTSRDAPEVHSCCGSMGNLSMNAPVAGSSQQPGSQIADSSNADHNVYNIGPTRSRRFS